MRALALFDFDGTLTTKDSLKTFLKLASKNRLSFLYLYYLRSISLFARLKLGLLDDQVIKEKRIKAILGDLSKKKLENLSREFKNKVIPEILRSKGIEKLRWHVKNGHDVFIVSASLDMCLKKWCTELGVGLLTNEVIVINEKITGNFKRPDCNKDQKVIRIRETVSLDSYDKIYAYGDTPGDLPMLELADEQFYKPFRD